MHYIQSTANSIPRAINAMLDHPVWFDRIYQELKTELDDIPENVPASRLARLPVLNAVIDETMRLFPALPQDFQRVVPPEGVEFCGKFLPGGTILNPQMYTVHTDPNLWEDPDSFKPERWLKENPTDQLNESFPFSRGVHACIGRNLAMSELRMLLSMLVYYFKFERVGNDDMSFNTISITTPRCHRLNVRLSERVH
jgi:cytochrome P450